MENPFEKAMSERTNEELVKIIAFDRAGYEPDAVEAAEKEIRMRELDNTFVEETKAAITAETQQKKLVAASKASNLIRLSHYIVDDIIIFVWLFILLVIIELSFPGISVSWAFRLVFYPLYFLLNITYYVYMEHKFQKTFGKMLSKTKVVTVEGQRPTRKDIFIRTFCRFIPFDNFSFLSSAGGFHDSISNTMVVKDTKKDIERSV